MREPSSLIGSPLTNTQPRSIHKSASRREHSPRSDITLDKRTPLGASAPGTATGWGAAGLSAAGLAAGRAALLVAQGFSSRGARGFEPGAACPAALLPGWRGASFSPPLPPHLSLVSPERIRSPAGATASGRGLRGKAPPRTGRLRTASADTVLRTPNVPFKSITASGVFSGVFSG